MKTPQTLKRGRIWFSELCATMLQATLFLYRRLFFFLSLASIPVLLSVSSALLLPPALSVHVMSVYLIFCKLIYMLNTTVITSSLTAT